MLVWHCLSPTASEHSVCRKNLDLADRSCSTDRFQIVLNDQASLFSRDQRPNCDERMPELPSLAAPDRPARAVRAGRKSKGRERDRTKRAGEPRRPSRRSD